MNKDNNIILCIPGQWQDRSAIVTAIAEANAGEYIFAGQSLMHESTKDFFTMDIHEHDADLKAAFSIAGMDRFTPEELTAIDKHTFVLFLVGKAGDIERAEKMLNAGAALLKAGGLGVKVETTGKALTQDHWMELAELDQPHKYYEAFVLLLKDKDNSIYSCGMHNLGMRDTIVSAGEPLQQTAELAELFCAYQVIEQPEIENEQTFRTMPESPIYRIYEEECNYYEQDNLFYNPYGMFRLVKE